MAAPSNLDDLPLADIVAHDRDIEKLVDMRQTGGFVVVRCPFDDGVGVHALVIHNPDPIRGKPSSVKCDDANCRGRDRDDFLDHFGLIARKPH